jgi:hypothetical protein
VTWDESKVRRDREGKFAKELGGESDPAKVRQIAAGLRGDLTAHVDDPSVAPGEAPIPSGTIRLFHWTSPDNVPSIKSEGLLKSKGRGDSGLGIDEPSRGVWASTLAPDEDKLRQSSFIEFYVHPDDISMNAEHFWNRDPVEWASENYPHYVILNQDAPSNQIVRVHEPWHSTFRYLMENYPTGDDKGMDLDSYLDPNRFDPEITPAVREWRKRRGSK